MFMSDFLVRGYAIETITSIPRSDLIQYQIAVLLVCIAVALGPLVGMAPWREANRTRRSLWLVDGRYLNYLGIFAWCLLALEVLKRLYTTDWSWSEAIIASLAPYGSWPWESALGNLGDQRFIFALISMLLPLSGLVLAYFVQTKCSWQRVPWLFGYIAVLALLLADGKRTPLLFVLGCHGVFYLVSAATVMRKVMVLGAVLVASVTLASAMYLFRVGGMGQIISNEGEGYEIVYQQDDNYYQTLHAINIATTTSERWDPVDFFYATAVSPIPRYFWPNKPALLQDYWGNYKDYWVTISFVGELVAMFGPILGLILAVIVGWVLYILLWRTYALTVEAGGIIVYLIVALYSYMVMRSLLNITQFMYLPAFAYAIFLVQRRHISRLARIRQT